MFISKLEPGEFSQRIIKLALQIPEGRVTTYGLLVAAAGGHPVLAQMVTHILGKMENDSKIPYHRIVYSNGKVWLNSKCRAERLKLYNQEGIKLDKNNKIINFEKKIFIPKL